MPRLSVMKTDVIICIMHAGVGGQQKTGRESE